MSVGGIQQTNHHLIQNRLRTCLPVLAFTAFHLLGLLFFCFYFSSTQPLLLPPLFWSVHMTVPVIMRNYWGGDRLAGGRQTAAPYFEQVGMYRVKVLQIKHNLPLDIPTPPSLFGWKIWGEGVSSSPKTTNFGKSKVVFGLKMANYGSREAAFVFISEECLNLMPFLFHLLALDVPKLWRADFVWKVVFSDQSVLSMYFRF